MDGMGSLQLAWTQGYNGSRADYINQDTICIKCAGNIKFVKNSGEESVFPSPSGGIGQTAVHIVNHAFAYTNKGLQPKINVCAYPDFRNIATLEGGAELEFIALAFSTSDFLVSVSGVPDFNMIIWDYVNGLQLCNYQLGPGLSEISFNPANWRQLCTTTEKTLTLWTVEQSDDKYMIIKQKVSMPALDGSVEVETDRDLPTRASTRLTRMTVDLPKSSIAGVKGEEAEAFAEYTDTRERARPISHVWSPAGDLYVGCAAGQLLKVDGETYRAKILYNPEISLQQQSSMLILDGLKNKEMSKTDLSSKADIDGATSAMSNEVGLSMTEGSMNCLALHKEGLFAAGEDGVLRQLEVAHSGHVKVVSSYQIGSPVSTMSFNSTFHKLALGGSKGCMHVYDLTNPNGVQCLFDHHYGNFLAIDSLGLSMDHCVTIRDDGELQIWQISTGKLVGCMSIGVQATSMACSPMCAAAVVGVASGYAYVVDLSNTEKPRVVLCQKVHKGPVKHLRFSRHGDFLFSASDDNVILVIDGRPSKKFEPLGFVSVEGEIESIATYTEDNKTVKLVAAVARAPGKPGADSILQMELSPELANDPRKFHASLKCNLSKEATKFKHVALALTINGISITNDNIIYALSYATKRVVRFVLPPVIQKGMENMQLVSSADYPGHQLAGGKVYISPHQRWIATSGMDGHLSVRPLGDLERVVDIRAHDYIHGGVHCVAYSPDCSLIMTAGFDGSLCAYSWNLSASGHQLIKKAQDAAKQLQVAVLSQGKQENEVLSAAQEWMPPSNLPSRPASGVEKSEKEESEKEQVEAEKQGTGTVYETPTPTPGSDATWLEARALEAIREEDKQYGDMKKGLRQKIQLIREKLHEMMEENESLPDIEKLDPHEFDLDIEEQQRLQAEGDALVKKIREDKEFDNLAKEYLTDLIRKECWDDMLVKGRGLTPFDNSLEVHNYPMKERTKEELDALQTAIAQRKVEMAELAARKQYADITAKAAATSADEEMENENGEDSKAANGSLGADFGGGSEYFYSQFELHSREHKILQIVLLQDAIHRIKQAFNKEFDEVYNQKEREISRIVDRNRRIRKILEDLGLPVKVEEPQMGIVEKPERLLIVEDHEVKVEKFLTPEQRRQQEEEKKVEEERKKREQQDNWRDRGLNIMMGGVLEVKKEDELKKDIPMPGFMTSKIEAEWTEDEKKLAEEYNKKVKELEEEREKYRKQLEQELKKLQSQTAEGIQAFNELLHGLFNRKIKTEMVIYQEELKILRLKYSLLQEEELSNRQEELNDLLESRKEHKKISNLAVTESKKQVEAFREQYELLTAEDKVMDKTFKKEFGDVNTLMVDQLYKLFRRRPRGQKARATADTPIYDPSSGNPFAERPSTARQNDLAKSSLELALADLDKYANAPEGCDENVWERMCLYRRQKIESEQLVKQKALVFAAMQAFLQKRQEEDEELKLEIEDLIGSLNKLKEDKLRFTCNLEVQLVLKQGQVEVDAGPFIHDFKDSILTHRSVVEDLNSKIRSLGETKIASMVESKDFRKSIIQLEWEYKKMMMEMEDLQNKMRDIQNLKVTREIQQFLNESDHDGKQAQEIAILEQTLQTQKQHHDKYIQEKKEILKKLRKTMKEKESANLNLNTDLEELNVSVNERQNIHEVNADKRSDQGRQDKYKEIVQRRKLVELAKAQAQEVAVLRAEVERLRMRTFPALVQVER